jgi:hypothetical protein
MNARVSAPVAAFPLFVRDLAQAFVLAQVEDAIGPLDDRAPGAPPTRDAFTLLGRVLAARVLRGVATSSQRPRLRSLLGLRPDDEGLAESLEQAWRTAVLPQALKDELELIALAYEDYLRALKLASAGSSGHGNPMLARLPAFMRADRRGKALGELVHALGHDLDEADRLLGRVRDAHALAVADEERDLLQLAAALGLQRADFLILDKLKDKGFFAADPAPGADAHDRAAQAYALYLADLRQAIARFARIMLRGCATLPALLEAAMVLVNGDPRSLAPAERDPEADPRYPEPLIVHPDRTLPRGGFIHGLPITFSMIEGEGEAMQRRLRDGFVYLVENPIVDRSSDDAERRGRDRCRVRRGGFFPGPVAARITGSGDRTVHPRLVSLRTHRGLQFDGTVPEGHQLVFTTDGQAFLDGVDVTGRCAVFKGALFGESVFDDPGKPHAFVRVVPPGALARNFPRPVPAPESPLPTLRLLLGDTDWQFDVEEGAFDGCAFDSCVFALPADDSARAALPPSAKVQLLWREHQPFTVRVLLPSSLQPFEAALLDGESLCTLVHAGLERFRAAGIRLEVDWFDETWVLDESVIRDSAVEAGLGVDFDGTVPAP